MNAHNATTEPVINEQGQVIAWRSLPTCIVCAAPQGGKHTQECINSRAASFHRHADPHANWNGEPGYDRCECCCCAAYRQGFGR